MRNHLAMRARQSQVNRRKPRRLFFGLFLGVTLGMLVSVTCAATKARKPPESKDLWLGAGLAKYEEWRDLLARSPSDARLMVEQAFEQAQQGSRTREDRVTRGFLAWRTLETVIDRERVERALHEYYRRFSGKRAKPKDFLTICRTISGRDLGWFYDYYVKGSDLPRITVRRTQGNAPNEVSGEILIEDAPPEFQVRVEMRLVTSTGLIQHSVATNGAATPFTVISTQPVIRIAVDPDLRILRRTR